MFDIEYKGGNTVVIATKKLSLVVDPRLSILGLKDIRVKDGVELATESRFRVDGPDARIVLDGPGEYEVGDFTILGVAATRHIDTPEQEKLATIYRIECGDSRIAVLGNIEATLTDDQLEALGVVDILILPVGGGGYTLDATSATALVRSIEPKIVVPVHYADPALEYGIPQGSFEEFQKELDVPVEETSKYKVKSAAALPQPLTIVKINRTA